jgi:hypothetical protein
MKSIFTVIIFICITENLRSQANMQTFNFWIGTWDAYWNGDTLRGTNTITKALKNNVVEENFKFNDGSFTGKSWSVYDSTTKIWKQTWVDDAGAYLTFTGGKEDDKVILWLTDKKTKNGKTIGMRMIFYNIKPDSFDWDWQSTTDDKNWKSNWLIHYKRK